MNRIFQLSLYLLFASGLFAQDISLYCETGREAQGTQWVYIYAENPQNQAVSVSAMSLMLAHNTHQVWQPQSAWIYTDQKWGSNYLQMTDLAQATGYGSGFSHTLCLGHAAGPQADAWTLPAKSKVLLCRLPFGGTPSGDAVYLVGPQENPAVSMVDTDGKSLRIAVSGQPVVAGLPVTLTHFGAEPREQQARIFWTSEAESDVNQYVVERSLDGTLFSPLTNLAPEGPSDYETWDIEPFLPITYYRLRWIDANGTGGKSETVAVQFSAIARPLKVGPNPSEGIFSLQFRGGLSMLQRVEVMDATGRQVWQMRNLPEGETMHMDLSAFPAGVYALKAVDQAGVVYSVSLLVR